MKPLFFNTKNRVFPAKFRVFWSVEFTFLERYPVCNPTEETSHFILLFETWQKKWDFPKSRKKLVEKFNWKCKNLIFFIQFLVIGLFSLPFTIGFPLLCNSRFSKNKKFNFLLGLNQNRPTCKESTTLKNRWFCVLRYNSHSPKILENANIIDISHYSNWNF